MILQGLAGGLGVAGQPHPPSRPPTSIIPFFFIPEKGVVMVVVGVGLGAGLPTGLFRSDSVLALMPNRGVRGLDFLPDEGV